MSSLPVAAVRCVNCGTELAPGMLSCPACSTLVYAERLKELARTAEAAEAEGRLVDASHAWQSTLDLLPYTSQQHAVISNRVADITKRLAAQPAAPALLKTGSNEPWWRRGWGALITLLVFSLGKLKFLLLGLTKLSTFVSMFAFFGVYWSLYGWPLALGLVISIYIHEMGHVAMLRRLGIHAGAPLFIPGIGALVLLKTHISDPSVDAKIGLAGPVWGLGAGLAAYVAYLVTGTMTWAAIAQLTAFINLFNLIPIWQLDGSRGFHALAVWQRWIVVAVIGAAYLLTSQKILLIVGAVALYRAFQRAVAKPDYGAMVTFVVLVAALSWLSTVHYVG